MSDCPLPFLELVERLREAGFDLTPQQYAQFRQAMLQGFGTRSIDDVRRLCRLLWVKPSSNYDAKTFERVFDQFLEVFVVPPPVDLLPPEDALAPLANDSEDPSEPSVDNSEDPSEPSVDDAENESAPLANVQPPRVSNQYPTAPPPRLFHDNHQGANEAENKSGMQVPIAIAAPTIDRTPVVGSDYRLTSMDTPLSERDLQALWSALKHPTPIGREHRLDLAATIRRMEQR